MWLKIKVPVTIQLIFEVRGFSVKGADLSQYFHGKDNEKQLAAKLKRKYDVIKDIKDYVISTINDRVIQVATNILAVKMVRKNRLNQCT